jgi:hypothetical protein
LRFTSGRGAKKYRQPQKPFRNSLKLRSASERVHNNLRYSVTCGVTLGRSKKAILPAVAEHLNYCEELVASTSPPVGRGVVSNDAQ